MSRSAAASAALAAELWQPLLAEDMACTPSLQNWHGVNCGSAWQRSSAAS